ncbi:MAG: SDR family NAD(P)-dependent oxidoreductase [Pseudomonas sp.]|uniref:SDR family oxidoreductase n=1 Tax=Pseudomonas sp. TaxID=306 RepID=UPI00121B53E2|nr:SDR family oxidoreductase [Pseudomonas sp.]RZI76925.1 MAG: SDR family NAD(P)-dependent oxidoreductase [Pseudomonas sp.]
MKTTRLASQRGTSTLITGTGGLGYEVALALARAGGRVILAGRNAAKGAEAMAAISAVVPGSEVAFEMVDLASLQSVRDLGTRLRARGQPLDRLINNAGIMSPPALELTADGHEMQFGVNYLAHFALTAEVLPLLRASRQARVVNVTSLAQHYAKFDLDDLRSEKGYHPGRAYCGSKLLQAMFARELQGRSDAEGWGVTSLAAHPGFAGTNLFETGGGVSRFVSTRVILPLLGQSAAAGALPTLFAATSPSVTGGELYGPTGFMQMSGSPGPGKYAKIVHDEGLRAEVWRRSEDLVGNRYG